MLAREVMQRNVRTVSPQTSLPDLERTMLEHRVGGFPVVDDDRLVGIVSRSDIVRQLCVERSVAEMTSDFFRDDMGLHEVTMEGLAQVANRIGERIEHLRVQDVMIRKLFTVSPDQPLRLVAETMVDHHIHRVLITEQGRLLGIITSLDIARLVANGRLKDA